MRIPRLLFIGSTAASGTDNLFAENVESNSEVTSSALGQIHALTATDTASNSEVTSPTLGQTHALTATDAASDSEVTAPALVEVTPIFAENVESLSEVTSAAIGQIHALLADNVESDSEVTTAVLGQIHAILAENIESLSEVTAPTLTSSGAVTGTMAAVESGSDTLYQYCTVTWTSGGTDIDGNTYPPTYYYPVNETARLARLNGLIVDTNYNGLVEGNFLHNENVVPYGGEAKYGKVSKA